MLTLSNLFPRPDEPHRGVFNLQLFRAVAEVLADGLASYVADGLVNLCPVPTWRAWRRSAIRQWQSPASCTFPTVYVPVSHVPLFGRNRSAGRYASALLGAAREAGHVEGVLATWLYPDGVAAASIADAHGVPCAILVQGSDAWHLDAPARRRQILDACARGVTVACVSKGLAERVVAAGVDPARVHVTPNGVDAATFRPVGKSEALAKLRERHAGPHDAVDDTLAWQLGEDATKLVVFVGNLAPVKGPDLLVEAFARLGRPEDLGAVRLCVIGEGPMRGRLERRALELGVRNVVHFLGRRPHAEVALWLNAADCLCLTSRSEGMPNAVIEALACGVPVVATDVGGCRELLADEPAARLVIVRDHADVAAAAEKVAAALLEVLASGPDRAGIAGRHRDRFSWRVQAERILSLMYSGSSRGNKQ